jgi:hypothetical protein
MEDLNRFSQIVIEFHWPFDSYRMNMLRKLNQTHHIIHIHGNNNSGIYEPNANIDNNIMTPQVDLPEVFEVTYINKKLCENFTVEMKEIKFPTIFDSPNNLRLKDYHFSIPIG